MKRFLMGVLTTLVIGVAVAVAVVYTGMLDVSADTPHRQFVYRMIDMAREQSINRSARDLNVPANLADVERIRRGSGNYAAMCVGCHLAPGKTDSEICLGLYPQPPDLSKPSVTDDEEAAHQFWIIKHGIKASGMPAWSKGGMEDDAIWDLVAFIQKMPALSSEQYLALVESSEGHSHGGLAGHDHEDMHGKEGANPSTAIQGGHDHSDDHSH